MSRCFPERCWRVALLAFLSAHLASTATVSADPDSFGSRYEQAVALYRGGSHRASIPMFEAAYGEKPVALILANIGQAYAKLGCPMEAALYYRYYLDLWVPDDLEESIEKALAAATANLVAASEEPACPAAPPPADDWTRRLRQQVGGTRARRELRVDLDRQRLFSSVPRRRYFITASVGLGDVRNVSVVDGDGALFRPSGAQNGLTDLGPSATIAVGFGLRQRLSPRWDIQARAQLGLLHTLFRGSEVLLCVRCPSARPVLLHDYSTWLMPQVDTTVRVRAGSPRAPFFFGAGVAVGGIVRVGPTGLTIRRDWQQMPGPDQPPVIVSSMTYTDYRIRDTGFGAAVLELGFQLPAERWELGLRTLLGGGFVSTPLQVPDGTPFPPFVGHVAVAVARAF